MVISYIFLTLQQNQIKSLEIELKEVKENNDDNINSDNKVENFHKDLKEDKEKNTRGIFSKIFGK